MLNNKTSRNDQVDVFNTYSKSSNLDFSIYIDHANLYLILCQQLVKFNNLLSFVFKSYL